MARRYLACFGGLCANSARLAWFPHPCPSRSAVRASSGPPRQLNGQRNAIVDPICRPPGGVQQQTVQGPADERAYAREGRSGWSAFVAAPAAAAVRPPRPDAVRRLPWSHRTRADICGRTVRGAAVQAGHTRAGHHRSGPAPCPPPAPDPSTGTDNPEHRPPQPRRHSQHPAPHPPQPRRPRVDRLCGSMSAAGRPGTSEITVAHSSPCRWSPPGPLRPRPTTVGPQINTDRTRRIRGWPTLRRHAPRPAHRHTRRPTVH